MQDFDLGCELQKKKVWLLEIIQAVMREEKKKKDMRIGFARKSLF